MPPNYPGSYFGQFDTVDFSYDTASGDEKKKLFWLVVM
jgi:hypothetical protein